MSHRPQFSPMPVIVNGDMSGNLLSTPSIIQKVSVVSYSLSWTGTPTGTFGVQVSNDYKIDAQGVVVNAGTWTQLPLSGTPMATGVAGTGFIDIDIQGAYAIQLTYAFTGGVGTLQAIVCGKVT